MFEGEILVLDTPCIETLYVPFSYKKDNVVGRLIKRLKYTFSEEIADMLGKCAVERLWEHVDWNDVECMVAVPLSRERLSWRGFNQAELLAKVVSRALCDRGVEVPVVHLLERTQDTAAQATLSRSERLTNLKGAFRFVGSRVPRSVLLIDDVYTTGATLNECASLLHEAGVTHVFGLAIAKKHV